MIDLEGIITMTNSTGIKKFNKASENEIIGHHFCEFLPKSVAIVRTAMALFMDTYPIDMSILPNIGDITAADKPNIMLTNPVTSPLLPGYHH